MPFGTHLPAGNYVLPGNTPGADKLGFVPRYDRARGMTPDPALDNKPRTIIPHNGFSMRFVNVH
jgi:hypothetical protein